MRYLLILLVIFINSKTLFSQTENFKFIHLTTGDGLSGSNINYILQDKKGFMWFATNEGLNRYDGYEFRIYKNIPGDSLSISNNKIESLLEDSQGNLWVCTTNGLNLYNRQHDNFSFLTSDKANSNSLSHNYVREIIEDKDVFWITTLGGGINQYNRKTNTFKHFRHDPKNSKSISLDWVWTVNKDSQNRLWFGTLGKGLNLFNRETGSFTRFQFSEHNTAINSIRCIFELSENVFLIGTNAGLVRFTYVNKTARFRHYKHNKNDEYSISGGHIFDIFKDSLANIWVANQLGLDIYNPKTDKFYHVPCNDRNINSISTDEIWDIEQDNQGQVWFGTYKGGINILNLNQKHFKFRKHNPDDNSSLVNTSVLAFEEINNNVFWLGIDHGGLSKFDLDKGTLKTYKHIPKDDRSLSADAVLSILADSKKRLWIGTWGGGLNLFNQKNERFEHLSPPGIYFRQWHIWDILEDYKGRIWTATSTDLCCYYADKDSFVVYVNNPDNINSLSHNSVWDILEDSNHELWIGTSAGLNKYDSINNNFLYYPYITINDKDLQAYTVYSLYEDSQKRLWIGTCENGLNLFNKETKRFKPFPENIKIQNSVIYKILEDNSGNLWLSTSKGIIKATIDANDSITELYNFNEQYSFYNAQFNIGAGFKSSSDEIFFGSNKGFIFFNSDSIKPNTYRPRVVFTGFKIYNEEVKIVPTGKTGSPLRQSITETQHISLNHKQLIFTIKYAALSYISPQRNQYAYKLEGFENKWNYVEGKRYATYTNLDPGEYIFKVKAANCDGFWNHEPASLRITIIPPFWKTWWFRSIISIFIIIGIYTIFQLRLRYLKQQKKNLKKMVNDRTKELILLNAKLNEQYEEISMQNEEINTQNDELEKHKEHLEDLVKERTSELEKAKLKAEESDRLKTSFLTNMSHEIRTPLNAIVGFSILLANTDVSDDEKLEYKNMITTSTDSLLMLVDDILDLSLIEANQLKLHKQEFNLNEHIEQIYMTFCKQNKGKNIEFKLINEIKNKELTLFSDAKRIKQVVWNFLNNAWKFTEKGHIILKLSRSDNSIHYSVTDTGQGITKENLNSIFERFRKIEDSKTMLYRGAGLGLAISKSITELLGGEIKVESEIGKGSVFSLVLPLQ